MTVALLSNEHSVEWRAAVGMAHTAALAATTVTLVTGGLPRRLVHVTAGFAYSYEGHEDAG